MRRGFGLIELLVYVSLLVVILGVVSVSFFWSLRVLAKAEASRSVIAASESVLRALKTEVREADSVYVPTTTASQLSLETKRNPPAGEEETYVDFFICAAALCRKREGEQPVALISDEVEVRSFLVERVVTGGAESVHMVLTLGTSNPGGRPELEAEVELTATVSIR